MHYVLVAGGNAFYERRPTQGRSYIPRTVIAQAGPRDSITAHRRFSLPQQFIAAAPAQPRRREPTPAPAPVLAAAPVPQPAPVELSIEALILADADG
jgi:hypothetical protein